MSILIRNKLYKDVNDLDKLNTYIQSEKFLIIKNQLLSNYTNVYLTVWIEVLSYTYDLKMITADMPL